MPHRPRKLAITGFGIGCRFGELALSAYAEAAGPENQSHFASNSDSGLQGAEHQTGNNELRVLIRIEYYLCIVYILMEYSLPLPLLANTTP